MLGLLRSPAARGRSSRTFPTDSVLGKRRKESRGGGGQNGGAYKSNRKRPNFAASRDRGAQDLSFPPPPPPRALTQEGRKEGRTRHNGPSDAPDNSNSGRQAGEILPTDDAFGSRPRRARPFTSRGAVEAAAAIYSYTPSCGGSKHMTRGKALAAAAPFVHNGGGGGGGAVIACWKQRVGGNLGDVNWGDTSFS